MTFQLVPFQIHLRSEHNELLLQTLLIQAQEMVFLKVFFQRIVVDVILLLAGA